VAKVGLEPHSASAISGNELQLSSGRGGADSGAAQTIKFEGEYPSFDSGRPGANSSHPSSHLFAFLLSLLNQLSAAERANLAAVLQAADAERKGGS
jgi:hypothetical protein